MKKLFIGLAAAGLLAGSAAALVGSKVSADNGSDPSGIVGAWEVTAVAPYPPHLFTFNADGTMLSTNPTNVQETTSKTDDSVGMGAWKIEQDHGTKYVVGTFEELNASSDTHTPTDPLSVSFKVQLTNNGNGFDGPASATLGHQDPNASHLTGTRLTVNQQAVNNKL